MAKASCLVGGCERPRDARGYCKAHYSRFRRYGDPNGPEHSTVYDRFYSRVDKNAAVPSHCPELGPCWQWTGSNSGNGYGRMRVGGVQTSAHRWSWAEVHGPIPDGLEIDHLCRNRGCVNPRHLEAVTPAENMRRMGAAITHCRRGHLFDETTTGWDRNNHRYCRVCGRDKTRRYRERLNRVASG